MRPGRAISRRTIAVRPGSAVALPSMRTVFTAARASRPPRAARCRATISSTRLRRRGRRGEQHCRREEQAPPHGAHLGTGLGRLIGRLGGARSVPRASRRAPAPGVPERDAIARLLGFGLARPRLGFVRAGLGLAHARLVCEPLAVLSVLGGALSLERLLLGGRHPVALELDVALRLVAFLFAHPAAVHLHLAERGVRACVERRRGERAVVRLACLRC